MAYKDAYGNMTIGYGFNINAGITQPEAQALLVAQVNERDTALRAYSWYQALDPARQSVCLDIAINAGLHGLLSFGKMITALTAQDWETASDECHVSNPILAGRYAKLAEIMLTGAA